MPPMQAKLDPGCRPQYWNVLLRHEAHLAKLATLFDTIDSGCFREDMRAAIEEGWACIATMQLLFEV